MNLWFTCNKFERQKADLQVILIYQGWNFFNDFDQPLTFKNNLYF